MTSIQVISDVHLEFLASSNIHSFLSHITSTKTRVDVLIIAGDLCVLNGDVNQGIAIGTLLFLCNNYNKVIYVPGNHEYYYSNFHKTNKIMEDISLAVNGIVQNRSGRSNVLEIVNNGLVEYNNIRFVCSTLWFAEDPLNASLTKLIHDFSYIDNCIDDFHQLGESSIEFISNTIRDGDIIITHHLPSYQSIAKEYMGDSTNNFFVHNGAEKIFTMNSNIPSLWIHGHTHSSTDYMINDDTRILCNPVGYYSHRLFTFENDNFDPHLIITKE
jgi:UDP-2,3-diacylglucosamine pyrophosphatase LpxH